MPKNITSRIGEYFQFSPYAKPVEWAIKNISFKRDKSAERKKLDLDFAPYLVDPISAWEYSGVKREVTFVAPEQFGKTLVWIVGLLWTFIFKPCLSMVIYKSDEKAEQINHDKLKPLMLEIPELAAELSLPRSYKTNCYDFSNITSYFTGAGTRITSVSAKVGVSDELDDWQEHEGKVSNLDDQRKRNRSYSESILFKVCTPTGGQGLSKSAIWEEFQNSSKGWWYLRCLGCNDLTMKSSDIHNLQFEATEAHEVKKGTCRLICPKCKHEHIETDKREMNIKGGYVHEKPELVLTAPGFQVGGLASQLADFCWDNIAQAQLNAGSSGSLKAQIYFDNSIRGLPFKVRRRDEKRETSIKRHCAPLPPITDIKYRLMTVDTQDTCFYWIARGFDDKDNSWLLNHGKAQTLAELETAWNTKQEGDVCRMCLIDSGGHRLDDVNTFVKNNNGVFMYKGDSRSGRWRPSSETKKLILVNPHPYQIELLYLIYGQEKRDNNYWFLPAELDATYIEQVLDMKPDNKEKSGNGFDKWKGSGNDHYFDCEKQMLALREMYKQIMKNSRKSDPRTAKTPVSE